MEWESLRIPKKILSFSSYQDYAVYNAIWKPFNNCLGATVSIELTDQEYEQIRAAIESWSNTAELAAFAEKGHGYGNSDSGFGVIYADDLD